MSKLWNLFVIVPGLALACGGDKKPATTMPTGGDPMGGETTVKAEEPPPPVEKPVEKPPEKPPEPPKKVMTSKTPDELKWTPLDPTAGDKGPMAASVWGDMQTEANGFFLKLPAGDKGIMHTHSSDYYAVAISGTVTNAQDGGKKAAALPTGSFWMQPANAAHQSSCAKGADCIVFTHWTGKTDISPTKAAKGAKADPKYVEKRQKEVKWTPFDPKNPKGPAFSSVWGDANGPSGMFIKIPAGSPPYFHVHPNDYHGVVIAGTVNNIEAGAEAKDLPPGSYYMQPANNKHTTNCKAGGKDCLLYLHSVDKFESIPAP